MFSINGRCDVRLAKVWENALEIYSWDPLTTIWPFEFKTFERQISVESLVASCGQWRRQYHLNFHRSSGLPQNRFSLDSLSLKTRSRLDTQFQERVAKVFLRSSFMCHYQAYVNLHPFIFCPMNNLFRTKNGSIMHWKNESFLFSFSTHFMNCTY